jgi:hypothetical protein
MDRVDAIGRGPLDAVRLSSCRRTSAKFACGGVTYASEASAIGRYVCVTDCAPPSEADSIRYEVRVAYN